MTSGRWIDLDRVGAAEMHALPLAIAEAMRASQPPVLVWLRSAEPQICVGASQDIDAEIDVDACGAEGVLPTRRCLGGGTVLVDERQDSFLLIMPRSHPLAGRRMLFRTALGAALDAYRAFGLRVRQVGTGDLWCGSRKILGSGAATVGDAHVLGASFLRRFDAALFARLVRAPSRGYREWLRTALRSGMTDWQTQGGPPDRVALARRFRLDLERRLGCRLAESDLHPGERAGLADARMELAEPSGTASRRLIPHGIKVNHGTYLLEFGDTRLILQAGRIARLQHAGRHLDGLRGLTPGAEAFRRQVHRHLGDRRASGVVAETNEAVRGIT